MCTQTDRITSCLTSIISYLVHLITNESRKSFFCNNYRFLFCSRGIKMQNQVEHTAVIKSFWNAPPPQNEMTPSQNSMFLSRYVTNQPRVIILWQMVILLFLGGGIYTESIFKFNAMICLYMHHVKDWCPFSNEIKKKKEGKGRKIRISLLYFLKFCTEAGRSSGPVFNIDLSWNHRFSGDILEML